MVGLKRVDHHRDNVMVKLTGRLRQTVLCKFYFQYGQVNVIRSKIVNNSLKSSN